MKKNYLFLIIILFSQFSFSQATNDDCANSQNIIISTAQTTTNFVIVDAAINNEEGCTGTTSDFIDIWYDFTMPVNGNLYVNGTISWKDLASYENGKGAEIQGRHSNQQDTGLSAGTNYKLRVCRYRSRADEESLSFTTQAFEEVTNDDCATAENIAVTTSESTVNFNIGGATIHNEEGCCGSTTSEYADIWYDFTMPVNGNLYVNGTISWNRFALYDSCGGSEIQCGDSNQLFTGLSAGTNYKLRVFRSRSGADNGYLSFTIQAFEIINNDDCASAENIVVTDTPTTVHFGIAGANINNEIGCAGSPAQDFADVWYEFTMPINGYLVINGTISWNKFALYDACNGTELACFDSSGNVPGLTSGTVYKLRVFRTLAHVDNQAYKSFTIHSTSTLSSNDVAIENNIRIYPNPAKDFIHISNIEDQKIQAIHLFNMLGKEVLRTTSKKIDISNYTSGIYLVKITTEKGSITKKIVIE